MKDNIEHTPDLSDIGEEDIDRGRSVPRDKSILAIYGAVAFLAIIALVSLYLSVKPEAGYAPLTLEIVLEEAPVSLAGGQLPVQVTICSTADTELLVQGTSTYVQADTEPALAVAGLSAAVVTAPNSCQQLPRALPLGTRMAPGLWYMNLIVSVVDASGKTQALNQRTANFVVIP